jgi:hypothetical protein
MNANRPIDRRIAIRTLAALGVTLLAGCAREGEGTIHIGKVVHSPDRLLAYREKSKTFARRRRR